TGLRTEQVLTIEVQLLSFGSGDFRHIMAADAAAKQDYDRIRREIETLPGVITVGVGSTMALRRTQFVLDLKAEGQSVAVGQPVPRAELRTADREYFRAAGIPLLKGRAFAATDQMMSGNVVIINQTLADKIFAGEDPIGKRIAWTGDVLRFGPVTGDWR